MDKLLTRESTPATPVDKLLTCPAVPTDKLPILLLAPAMPVDKLLTCACPVEIKLSMEETTPMDRV